MLHYNNIQESMITKLNSRGLFLEYNKLLRDAIKISSIFMSVPIESLYNIIDKGMNYTKWVDEAINEFDEELSSEGFTITLADYLNSYLNIHKMFRNMYPFIVKSIDLFNELYAFNIVNIYISLISNILHVYRRLDVTPYDIVYKKGCARLLHYKGKNNSYPLLIVYSIINRYHIMDISKERSVIKRLLEEGIDVYLLEWGDVSYSDLLSLKDYLGDIKYAVERIKAISNKDKISMLGYCWGGILAVIYASIHKDLNNLIIMAAPIDTSKDNTTLAKWTKSIDAKRFIEEYGHMHGQILNIIFFMRNPVRYTIAKYLTLFKRLDDPIFLDTFMAVEQWLYNTPIIPGKVYEEIVENIYKDNRLANNSLIVDDKQIVLNNIDIPLLTLVADNDDLTSPDATLALHKYVSSKECKSLRITGGHVGLCISSMAHKMIWPEVAKWIIKNSNI